MTTPKYIEKQVAGCASCGVTALISVAFVFTPCVPFLAALAI